MLAMVLNEIAVAGTALPHRRTRQTWLWTIIFRRVRERDWRRTAIVVRGTRSC